MYQQKYIICTKYIVVYLFVYNFIPVKIVNNIRVLAYTHRYLITNNIIYSFTEYPNVKVIHYMG